MDIIRSQQVAGEGEVNMRKFSQNKNAYGFCYINGQPAEYIHSEIHQEKTSQPARFTSGLHHLISIIRLSLPLSLSVSLSLSTIQPTQCS